MQVFFEFLFCSHNYLAFGVQNAFVPSLFDTYKLLMLLCTLKILCFFGTLLSCYIFLCSFGFLALYSHLSVNFFIIIFFVNLYPRHSLIRATILSVIHVSFLCYKHLIVSSVSGGVCSVTWLTCVFREELLNYHIWMHFPCSTDSGFVQRCSFISITTDLWSLLKAVQG